jgi:ribonucleoside-diphosphate reductase alpha subunit
MKVEKRNGTLETASFNKITHRILAVSKDIKNIDAELISKKVISQIHDNIKTSDLDELIAETSIHLSTLNPGYGDLSKRIIISNNHKETPSTFSNCVEILFNGDKLVSQDLYQTVINNKELINSQIETIRDFDFDYFGFKTLEKNYLLKLNGKVIERIQYLFMRVSLGLHKCNLDDAFESYRLMSQKYFIHGSPTLFNAGTKNPQLLSCFLLGTEDSIDGIYKTISDCAKISKWSGGIGIHVSNIRSRNSKIKGTNGKSTGILPMLRVYNETAKYVNQGSRRPGSIAVYLEPHHPDLEEFLEIRKNTGYEDDRARDLFTGLYVSDLFMKRVGENGQWSFFNPSICTDLNNIWGEKYERKYIELEKKGLATKTVKARDIWAKIINSQIETGTPYILYKCTINRYNNQSNLGTIKSSNLCAEITEYSDDKEYACCTLASIGLPKCIENGEFNFYTLGRVVKMVVKNLNNVIDLNYYPVIESKKSNLYHRPIGIGVSGLADVFSILKIDFDSDAAKELNLKIFDSIYYYALRESCNLAIENGSYCTYSGSPLSKGITQFDMRNVKSQYDWAYLKSDINLYGVRNSLLTALMPTATTSQVLGYNECFEPYTSNIYSRRTLAGDFTICNKYLVQELMDLNLWDKKMKDTIISNNGSIQAINSIPADIKSRYRTVWELPQKKLIDMAIDRSPFICQSQSMNLFFKEPNIKNLSSSLFYGWKRGLKTGCYYVRSQPKAQAQQFTVEGCSMCQA